MGSFSFPPNPYDTGFDRYLVMVSVLLFWLYLILALIRFLRRRRPELAVGLPLAVAYGIRALAIPAVTLTGVGNSLRGGDEVLFMQNAHAIAAHAFPSNVWNPFGIHRLYQVVFALQLKFGQFTVSTLRLTEVGVAVIGTALIVVSVYDLASPRAARLAAWLLAVEPASIFFSQLLHKEPFMMLATGLVAFGGTRVWRRLNLAGLMTLGLGCAVAVATRPYAGWLLIGAAALVTLQAAVRHVDRRKRAITALLGLAAILAIGIPFALHKTTKQGLRTLRIAQKAYAQDAGTPGNNLALEKVDFSSRNAIITNLPRRISELLLRPWPWQVGDTSQQLGVLGTLVAYSALYLLVLYFVRWRTRAFTLAAPLLYPLFFLTIAYAVSVGNAGTGFRYRSELVVPLIAAIVVLREAWLTSEGTARARSRSGRQRWHHAPSPVAATVSVRLLGASGASGIER